jgi:hypothetical protein
MCKVGVDAVVVDWIGGAETWSHGRGNRFHPLESLCNIHHQGLLHAPDNFVVRKQQDIPGSQFGVVASILVPSRNHHASVPGIFACRNPDNGANSDPFVGNVAGLRGACDRIRTCCMERLPLVSARLGVKRE